MISTKARSCDRKKPYPTLEKAIEVRKFQEQGTNFPLWIYSCKYCTKYHLTKMCPPKNERINDGFFRRVD